VSQTIFLKQFDNGLTLAAEQMPWLESVALSLHLDAGCGRDPMDKLGLCNLVCEMAQRGAGPRNSREFLDAMENLGVDHSASVSVAHSTYSAAMVADKLSAALPLYADLVRAPRLPEDQLEDARQVCFHEIRSVEDDFAQKTMQQVRRRHYGEPLGRSAAGELDHVRHLTIDDVRGFVQSAYGSRRAILAVAGKFDWPQLEQQVTQLFGDWPMQAEQEQPESPPQRGYEHMAEETNQTHIGLAFPSVPYRDPNYFLMRAAVGVLSVMRSAPIVIRFWIAAASCATPAPRPNALKRRWMSPGGKSSGCTKASRATNWIA
jgi:predicted Zn-dependent peptidase